MTSHKPIRLHIGHHFYAAGNVGDDLMVAGFLSALSRSGVCADLTCAVPFDRASQRARFPQVEWVEYQPAARERCVAACDAWLGLGASPFQGDFNTWFLDHLMDELALCQRYRKPMFFLCVGLNNRRDLDHPQTRTLLRASEHVWTRDAASAELFAGVCGAASVTAGADLSHIYLRRHHFGPVERDVVALALNFEDLALFEAAALSAFIAGASPSWRLRWLAQEVRELPGSETAIYNCLPTAQQARLDVRVPPYATGSLDELLSCWGTPDVLVTSRYHATAIGAWMGARLVPIERSDKLRGLTAAAGLEALPAFVSAQQVRLAVDEARSVSRATMEGLEKQAATSCDEFFRRLGRGSNMPA